MSIGIREAARRKGVNASTISRAIVAGRIAANGNGIDEESLARFEPRAYGERGERRAARCPGGLAGVEVGVKEFVFRRQWWIESAELGGRRIEGDSDRVTATRWRLYFQNTTHGKSRYFVRWDSAEPPVMDKGASYELRGVENNEFIREAGWRWVHRVESIVCEATGEAQTPQPPCATE